MYKFIKNQEILGKILQNSHYLRIFMVLLAILFIASIYAPLAVFVSIIIFIGVILISHKPEYGLYLVSFLIPYINLYIPFEFFNVQLLGFVKDFEIPVVDLAGIFLLAIFVVKILISKFFYKKNIKIYWPAIFAFVLFFSISILSSLNASSWFGSIWYTLRWIFIFYAVYIWLPVNIISSPKILCNVISVFLFSAFIVALMGVASLLQQDLYSGIIRLKPINIFGIYPIGENQKQISEIMASAGMLSLALLYFAKDKKQKILLWLLFIFFEIILIGSFSRAAWLMVFIHLIAVAFFFRRNIFIHIKKILIASIIALTFLIPLGYYMFNLQGGAVGLSSNKHRKLLTSIAIEGFYDNPVIGNGSGEFFTLESNNIRYRATDATIMDSHGIWQKLLSESGILGVFSFILFIYAVLKKPWRLIKNNIQIINYNLILIYFSFSAFLSIFIFEFFDTNFYRGKVWFMAGILLAITKLINNKQNRQAIKHSQNIK